MASFFERMRPAIDHECEAMKELEDGSIATVTSRAQSCSTIRAEAH
jgi:hypothetical protein